MASVWSGRHGMEGKSRPVVAWLGAVGSKRMTTYHWTPGARFKADAQKVGTALAKLSEKHDARLTARIVVDAARPKNSVLHTCFEWDDVRAAELFREEQARKVLHSIRAVNAETGDDTPMRC